MVVTKQLRKLKNDEIVTDKDIEDSRIPIDVILDNRWTGGTKTYSIGLLLSLLNVYEKLKDKISINLYSLGLRIKDDNEIKELYKLNFQDLYNKYKERKLIDIVYYFYNSEYIKDKNSKRVNLDTIINEYPKLYANMSLNLFNEEFSAKINELYKQNFAYVFHSDYVADILLAFKNEIENNRMNLPAKHVERIYNLFEKRLKKGRTDKELIKDLFDLLDELYISNTDDKRILRFRKKYDWIRLGMMYYINSLLRAKDGLSIFPSWSMYSEVKDLIYHINTFFKDSEYQDKIKINKFTILHEPLYMVSLEKIYKDEIKSFKDYYSNIYGNSNKIWLLYVGRTSYERGFKDLVEAYERLLRDKMDIGLIIISDGLKKDSKDHEILREIKKNHHNAEIHIYGKDFGSSVHNYVLYYIGLLKALGNSKKAMYINPTYMESYGLSTLEALVLGYLPVIYRNVEALEEFREFGYLKEELGFKDKQELYNKIKDIIKDIKDGKYDKYIDKETINYLKKEVDPENLADKYKDIIEGFIKEYNDEEENNQKKKEILELTN
ncbi:hypothetical protein MJ1_0612 [Nanobdella aerobiophila]|uniref:Glycosyl transferase family 1 domain-containing protein n=1 Tax=Nanobdella aerobiophila TaxID=2586965 RepID=A0A915WRY6_9ARCH|nr:glycosyltransferase [Nanobdella aerobiophila]BBL45759.1 hypothetical protein MJ1_0612 [Nanobdella aerobiophila]